MVDKADALSFVSDNHRAVLATRRAGGDPQMSPVTVGVEDDKIVISSRETAYKVRNIRREPSVSLCVMNDGFFGHWIQVDGTADTLSLPDAMESLVEYYRGIRGGASGLGRVSKRDGAGEAARDSHHDREGGPHPLRLSTRRGDASRRLGNPVSEPNSRRVI